MKLWSGPGRALQAHVTRWEYVERGVQSMERFARTEGTLEDGTTTFNFRAEEVSEVLVEWANFARSYGNLNDGDVPDRGLVEAPVKESESVRKSVHDAAYRIREDETVAAKEDLMQPWTARRNIARGMQMLYTEAHLLDKAVTHYVALHISELVTEIANLAQPEPLFPTDLPTPDGLIVLEHPILVNDLDPLTGAQRDDLPLPVRAIGWTSAEIATREDPSVAKPGVYLILYTEADSYNEIYVPAVSKLLGRATSRLDGARLETLDFNPWGFGTIWGESHTGYDDTDQHLLINSVAYVRRWFMALMRLMWQDILSPAIFTPPRQTRRRLERMSWTGGGDVKVLRLRRIYRSDDDREEGESGWVLNHRYIRRGHWRNQFYPSLGPVSDPASHRLIWIMPTVCGPEDRPLIVKHNVTAFVR